METLDGTEWDIVITGTGIAESLLALSLSRSGKRILHLDPNDYYGGDEAALSLSEIEAWAKRHSCDKPTSTFSNAAITRPEDASQPEEPKLGSSRAYSIALAPQVIYSQSNLISMIVSARIHNQLDFQAVGSWFVLDAQTRLLRVPGGREDIFKDDTLDFKSKRSLMKFLRFVAKYEEQPETWADQKETPFPMFLEQKFGLPLASIEPVLALTMSLSPSTETPTELALSSIARHARSIGTFGPGFAAVLPKWGGLAELAQVACRGCAVGGGVYVLSRSVEQFTSADQEYPVSLELSGGEHIKTHRLVGSSGSLPPSARIAKQQDESLAVVSKSISVVSSSLAALFPPTSEGGVTPAGAVVMIPSSVNHEPPVYILLHSSEAGECPSGQTILYTSVVLPHYQGFRRLEQAVASLLQGVGEDIEPRVLWTLQYQRKYSPPIGVETQDNVIQLSALSSDLALEDGVLECVKVAWKDLTGEPDEVFMKFEAREGSGDDENT